LFDAGPQAGLLLIGCAISLLKLQHPESLDKPMCTLDASRLR
jgi:hypothetical protein